MRLLRIRAAKINIDTVGHSILYFSKRAAPPGNPCSLSTLTRGLPEPSPILYQRSAALSIRSNTYSANQRKSAPNAAILPNRANRWFERYLRKRGKRKVRFSPGVNTNFSARKGVFLVELRQTLFSPLFFFTLSANPLPLPFSHEKPLFTRFPSNRFFLPPYGAAVCPLVRTPARIPHPRGSRGGLCLCGALCRSRSRSPFHVKPREACQLQSACKDN